MEKRKYIPKAVYDALAERLSLKKPTIKMRIYKRDLAMLEMVATELEKYKKRKALQHSKAEKIKQQLNT